MKSLTFLLAVILIFSSCKKRNATGISNICSTDHIKTALIFGQFNDSLTHVLLKEIDQLKPITPPLEKWPEEKLYTTFSNYADTVFNSKINHHYDSLIILTGLTFSLFNYGWQQVQTDVPFNDLNMQDQYALIQKGYAGVCNNISDFFYNILNYYGYQNLIVNAYIKGGNRDFRSHVFNVVKTNDDKYIICDATFGVVFCDTNCTPLNFLELEELLMIDSSKVEACKIKKLTSLFSQPDPCLYPNFDWLYDINNSTVYYYPNSSFNKFIVQSERDIEDWEQSETVRNTYLSYLKQKGLPEKWEYFYIGFDSVSMEGPEWLKKEVEFTFRQLGSLEHDF